MDFGRQQSTQVLVAGNIAPLRALLLQAENAWLYWTEGRPEERGRVTLMRATLGAQSEILVPAPYSVRSRVHEYGGGDFLVADGTAYFVNDDDEDIYRLATDRAIQRITEQPHMRFADFVVDKTCNRLIAVAECTPHGDTEEIDHARSENCLVASACNKGTIFMPRLEFPLMAVIWLGWRGVYQISRGIKPNFMQPRSMAKVPLDMCAT